MKDVVVVVAFMLLYFPVTLFLCRKVKFTVRDLTMSGIFCALTLVLSYVRIPLPTGATISCVSMIPLMFLSIAYDYKLSIVSGFMCGIIAMLICPGWQPVHWGQVFVEHLVCFSCLGYAGIFGCEKKGKEFLGILLASVLKLTGHILSGVIFFSENAWDGFGAWKYSIWYNVSSVVPEVIISLIVFALIPAQNVKKVLKKK